MRTNVPLQVPLRPRLSANPSYSTRFETDADCFIPPNEPRKLFVASHGRMSTAHQGHEFERKQIIIREGKGSKDRCVPHPQKIISKLKAQIERVVKLHEQDLVSGAGWGWLPYTLADKYPEAGTMLVEFFAGRDEVDVGNYSITTTSLPDRVTNARIVAGASDSERNCTDPSANDT